MLSLLWRFFQDLVSDITSGKAAGCFLMHTESIKALHCVALEPHNQSERCYTSYIGYIVKY